MNPIKSYDAEEVEEESPDGAQRLYELGQELMDMAIAQGYSPDGEESEEEEEEVAAPAAGGKDKMKIALGLLGK